MKKEIMIKQTDGWTDGHRHRIMFQELIIKSNNTENN